MTGGSKMVDCYKKKSKTVQKDIFDRFYTKPDVARGLFPVEKIEDDFFYVEPTAGLGAFYDLLPPDRRFGGDLVPTKESIDKGIIQQDALQLPKTDLIPRDRKLHWVGNLPFGVRNSLNIRLITMMLSYDNTEKLSFVLPKVWNKPSNQKIFPREWRLVNSEDVSNNAFMYEGAPYHVPCVFQEWVKGGEGGDLRWPEHPKMTHPDFTFSKDYGDFFVMGAAPRTIKDPQEVHPNNRGYWITANEGVDVDLIRSKIQSIPWENLGCSSVNGGAFWISIPEFIKHYSEN